MEEDNRIWNPNAESRSDESLPSGQDGAGGEIEGAREFGHGREAALAAADLPAAADIAAPGDRAVGVHIDQEPVAARPAALTIIFWRVRRELMIG